MSIRLRLALWYTGFLAILLLLFAPAAHATLERQLLAEVDRWLTPLSERVVDSLNRDPKVLEGFLYTANPTAVGEPPTGLPQRSWLQPFTSSGVFVELLDASGRSIARSPNLGDRTLSVLDTAFASARWGSADSYTATVDGTRYRILVAPLRGDREPRGSVLAARTLQQVDDTLAKLRIALLVGSTLSLLGAFGFGWLMAGRSLRPVEQLTRAAGSMARSQRLGKHLGVRETPDEVGRLAATFNRMLIDLEEAYAAQRRFIADASHELRSPLTSIRSNIDILRRALNAPTEDRAEALADVAAEVDRMTRLISDLLLLARADAGNGIEMERVALDELLGDAYRQMHSRSDGTKLEMAALPEIATIGNGTLLRQLLLILLDNAFKYTPRGGRVRLSLERQDDMAVISVSDTGMGIAREDLPHVFERFYRADKARARDEGGTGLGLAIAQRIVQEHGGELAAESEVGKGTTFRVRLPAA